MRNHLGADKLIPMEQTTKNPDQGKGKIDREVLRQLCVILPGWQASVRVSLATQAPERTYWDMGFGRIQVEEHINLDAVSRG